jgi:exodeoxyribonuclease VII large subunit
MNEQRILSVSELTGSIRGLLETRFPFVAVSGEISNLRRPASGHLYFTLKDAKAQLKAVLFKMQQRYMNQLPKDGQLVICHGRLSVYEPRGDYQLIIDTIERQGRGDLQQAFEQLKRKLAEEGLFQGDHKQPLPPVPGHITLLTSPRGAAVHDFLRVATTRFPLTKICIYPVAVQGEQAAGEIARAIAQCNRQLSTDILILCRGGGSIEDLWAFNEEELARTVFHSKIPVVSAVGHEIDYTITDFVADLRAPTPSAAAEMVLPDQVVLRRQIAGCHGDIKRSIRRQLQDHSSTLAGQQKALQRMRHPLERTTLQVDHTRQRIHRAVQHQIATGQQQLDKLSERLGSQGPARRLATWQERVAMAGLNLERNMGTLLRGKNEQLGHTTSLLDTVSPLATLARGYSIVKRGTGKRGRVIVDSGQVERGDTVSILLHRGRLHALVKETEAAAPKNTFDKGGAELIKEK